MIAVAYPIGILLCSYFVCGGNIFTDRDHPKVVLTRNIFVGSIGITVLFTSSLKFVTNDWMHDFVLPLSAWIVLLIPLAIWNSIERINASNGLSSNALLIVSSLGIFGNDFDRYYFRSFVIVKDHCAYSLGTHCGGAFIPWSLLQIPIKPFLFESDLYYIDVFFHLYPFHCLYSLCLAHAHPLFYNQDKRFTLAQCLITFIFGVFAGLAYEHSNRLLPTPIIMHILGNSVGCS